MWYRLVDKKIEQLPEGVFPDENDRENRKLGKTVVPDGTYISTVFLNLDHSFGDDEGPILFETMVFGNVNDFNEIYCERYSDYDDALKGHWEQVEKYGGTKPEVLYFDEELFTI